jgi:hypothetical protein
MSKKFDRLKERIAREYEAKGVSPEKANEWATKTAGKVYEEQQAKKGRKE